MIRAFCDDLIKRCNVHVFEGKDKFEEHFLENFKTPLADALSEDVIDHYHKLARFYLFEEDPD